MVLTSHRIQTGAARSPRYRAEMTGWSHLQRAAHRHARERCTRCHVRIRIDRRQRLDVDQRARAAVLLVLEFRLVRFEHANLAPAIEEQHNGADPQDQHQRHDENLFGAHDYGGTGGVCGV